MGLERLILHHLILYCDPELLVFVINTAPQDDVSYLYFEILHYTPHKRNSSEATFRLLMLGSKSFFYQIPNFEGLVSDIGR